MATARDLKPIRRPKPIVDMLPQASSTFRAWRCSGGCTPSTATGGRGRVEATEENQEGLCWCRCDADLWRVAAECVEMRIRARSGRVYGLVGRTFGESAAAGAAPEASAGRL